MKAWLPFAAVCLVALGRVVTARGPELPAPIDDDLARAAFRAVASEEALMRRDAAKDFPTDLWSRDDDFHQHEWRKVRDWASAHRVNTGDALRAMDDGIRAHWPHGNTGPLVVTTPPCRPRAIY